MFYRIHKTFRCFCINRAKSIESLSLSTTSYLFALFKNGCIDINQFDGVTDRTKISTVKNQGY